MAEPTTDAVIEQTLRNLAERRESIDAEIAAVEKEAQEEIDAIRKRTKEAVEGKKIERRKITKVLKAGSFDQKPKAKKKTGVSAGTKERIAAAVASLPSGEFTIRQAAEAAKTTDLTLVKRALEAAVDAGELSHGELRIPDDSSGYQKAQHYKTN